MNNKNIKRDINLFDSIFKDRTRNAVDIGRLIRSSAKFLIAMFVVLLVFYGGRLAYYKIATSTTVSANEKLLADNNMEEIENNSKLRQELQTGNDNLTEQLNTFDKSIKLKMEDIEAVAEAQPDKFSVSSFEYDEGVLKLVCVGTEELSGTDFANILREQKHFATVNYEGFKEKEEGSYEFNLSITLNDPATADAENAEDGKEAK